MTWTFNSFAQLKGVVRRVENPKEVILLLHGLGERGKRIFRKLLPYLPQTALIIAPNAPFPIPRPNERRMDYGHSWYFYDKLEKKYFINQDLSKFWIRDLVSLENSQSLPVTIIGFSQGGYLSPQVAAEIPETKLVIGLSCEFRSNLVEDFPRYKLIALHGKNDTVVPLENSLKEIDELQKRNIQTDFYLIEDCAHEINQTMGLKIESIMRQYGK